VRTRLPPRLTTWELEISKKLNTEKPQTRVADGSGYRKICGKARPIAALRGGRGETSEVFARRRCAIYAVCSLQIIAALAKSAAMNAAKRGGWRLCAGGGAKFRTCSHVAGALPVLSAETSTAECAVELWHGALRRAAVGAFFPTERHDASEARASHAGARFGPRLSRVWPLPMPANTRPSLFGWRLW
jgi:hypothetical protein